MSNTCGFGKITSSNCKYTMSELKNFCRMEKIKGYSGKSKMELCELIVKETREKERTPRLYDSVWVLMFIDRLDTWAEVYKTKEGLVQGLREMWSEDEDREETINILLEEEYLDGDIGQYIVQRTRLK